MEIPRPFDLQDEQVRAEAQRAQTLVESLQVAHHLRTDVRVDHGGGAALVLADDRHHLVGERHPLEAAAFARSTSAQRRSWSPFSKLCSRQTAIDSTSFGAECLDGGVDCPPCRAVPTSVPPSVQAPAHRQAQVAWHQHRGVRAGGGRRESARKPRRASRKSRKPRVTSIPTRAPLPSSTVLVATVEPCRNSVQSRQQALDVRLEPLGRRAPARRGPRGSESAGTEGVLKTWNRSPASTSTMSVKVPPTSTAMRHGDGGETRECLASGPCRSSSR